MSLSAQVLKRTESSCKMLFEFLYSRKKENKNPREDGTPPPHRDFKPERWRSKFFSTVDMWALISCIGAGAGGEAQRAEVATGQSVTIAVEP